MECAEAKTADPLEIALVPLAVPLLAGPGALATASAYSETNGLGPTALAVSLVLLLAFGCFLAGDWLFR